MESNQKSDEVPIKNIPQDERITRLNNIFYEEFKRKPSFFVRVPGRVNIIGEHIDYCGYPVLPMALEQDILVAADLLKEPELNIRNINKKYDDFNVKINTLNDIEIKPDSNGKPFWYNYVLCGIKGAIEHLNGQFKNGLQLYIDGNIPPASGLSSSSALVSAACLAFLYAQNATLYKTEIASLCANCERYIGTQGGGMDQAIAFLAEKFCAQYITWQPLKATVVALPEDAVFVVAHSLAESNKAATNDFNRRVIECRLAAKILATLTGATSDKNIITLSQVQKNLGNSLKQMVELVNEHLPKEIYTKNEISSILGTSVDEIDELYLTPNTRHLTEFKLKQRALHVYQEAMRVDQFREICLTISGNISNSEPNANGDFKNDTLEILGKLMSDSHKSLKELYECSHENLDRLINISREMNIHSRLTGAGWGGCIVALCPKNQVEKYIETLKEIFYENYCKIDKNKSHYYIFATMPNHGAIVYK